LSDLAKNIYYVQGVITEVTDLQRAGVEDADNIIILGEGVDSANVAVDARNIMVFRLVKAGQAFPIIQIEHGTNSQFLGSITGKSVTDYMENAYYAAGQVFVTGCLDSVLVQAYFNQFIEQLVAQLLNGTTYSFPVAEYCKECTGKSYSLLVNYLLENGLIPLALYRSSNSRLRYVATNPKPTTQIREDDIVIVIDTKPPPSLKMSQALRKAPSKIGNFLSSNSNYLKGKDKEATITATNEKGANTDQGDTTANTDKGDTTANTEKEENNQDTTTTTDEKKKKKKKKHVRTQDPADDTVEVELSSLEQKDS